MKHGTCIKSHPKALIDFLFVTPTESLWRQLFRYSFVGGVAFVVDCGSLYVLTEFVEFHHLLSAALAFVLGLVTNYLLSISWVFNNRRSSNAVTEFIVFAIIGVVGLGINEGIIYLGTDVLGIHYMLSKLFSTAIVFFWNFFARRLLLFSGKK